tara:strand:- start:12 stop:731 length:720 start_codon:yes stop_codon:yes gene_type:complete
MSTSEYDEYGFPLENFTEPPVVKPRVRCCSHCRSPNHTRNQCTAYRYSEAYDENSSLYREWNYPNPVAARYIREKKEYKRSHPSVKVCNHTLNDLYIYQNIYYDDLKKQFVIPGNTTKTFTKEIVKEKYLPFQYYLVWGDRGDNLTMNDLQREDVENFISLKYGGGNYEIDAYGNSYIDPWKTAALKSRYLLEQLVRLGAKNNENYEPILDLLEDIEFPEVSESDKEDAGIPSVFTNYT